ncbi:MAG TPA: serine hydrolase domain-containing protein [Blastocatellia bacterium]|nr:serine hydrolase domain-containing protein [Blastocatellia bacterium]
MENDRHQKPFDGSDVDRIMTACDRQDSPGASVIVIKNGETIFKRSYGLAEVESRRPATTDTNYRLASVTKQFTAMCVLMLAERKKLSLHDPVARFFPKMPDYGGQILVRHLLNHTSGLIAYEDVMPAGTSVPLKDKDVLHLLEQQRRTYFAPGSKFRYSNSGYALLALIVEAVGSISFAGFLKANIFDPLGMKATVAFENGISTVQNRAYGYSPRENGFERTDQSLTSSVLGDGGIYSSVEDLFRWDQALYSDKLVSLDTLKRAFTSTIDTGEKGQGYGYGWFVGSFNGAREISHSGETVGFRNFIGRYPDQRLSVIVLANRSDARPADLTHKIVNRPSLIATR